MHGKKTRGSSVLKLAKARAAPVYEVRPRKDHRGVDLISDVLPFGRLWCGDFVPRLSVTPFNGVCGNNRVGSVYGDDAKSSSPERLARALGHGNSLRTATQLGSGACPRYRFCDCGPHSAETDQSGESALLISLISLSLCSQFHFVARPNVGRVYSRSHDAVIRVYDAAGNVIETHEHAGDFKEW
jgi:hypothetical protein